jgi:hypothetical protein
VIKALLLCMSFHEGNLVERLRMRDHAAVRIGFAPHARTRRLHAHGDMVDNWCSDQVRSSWAANILEVDLEAGQRLPLGLELIISDMRKRLLE